MIKIVVLGECSSGKTSLIRNFIYGTFDPESRPTIGANFFEKSFYLQNSEINLQFWDTTGQDGLKSQFDHYLRGAAGAIIVQDYRKAKAREFKEIKDWRELLYQKASLSDGRPIPTILVLNKADLPAEEEPSQRSGSSLSVTQQIKDLPVGTYQSGNTEKSEEESKETESEKEVFADLLELLSVNAVFKTSAKTGKNVKVAIAGLVREILKESSFINRMEQSGDKTQEAGEHPEKRMSASTGSSQQEKPHIKVAPRNIKQA